MDEILALQAALATAQDTKSSIRLSERNIVELVNKLKSLDLLDDTLLYTLNGKEYLTEARLDAEIKREVKRSGGRVPVTDLQPALNVDVAHCERRARALACGRRRDLRPSSRPLHRGRATTGAAHSAMVVSFSGKQTLQIRLRRDRSGSLPGFVSGWGSLIFFGSECRVL